MMAGEAEPRPTNRDQLRMFILDVLQHDVAENIDSILRLLNNTGCIGWRQFWSHDFTKREVVDAIHTLVHDGLILPFHEDATVGELVPENPSEISIQHDARALWFGRM